MDHLNLQKRNLDRLVENKGFQFTDVFFPYTSGEIGPYYVQSAVILTNGEDYKGACDDMEKMIKENNQSASVISGGETRDWLFSFPMSDRLGLGNAMIYKNGKVLGADMKGKEVIHVADLNNEGSSPRDMWVPTIKSNGGAINQIYFYVDRMEDGVEVMKDLGLESYALVPLDKNAWDYLQQKGVVSKEVYNSLRTRMEDKDLWAKNMLRSDRGLEVLANMLNFLEKKNRAKGEKILNVGYPEIKDELLYSMRAKKLLIYISDEELL